ncbi:unnamed protein product [Dicrocoelium dendriticum]|nr:unnamed protein product [Dicrocoelium dendriticum]
MSANSQPVAGGRPLSHEGQTVRDMRASCLRIALRYSRNKPHIFRLMKNSGLIACFAVSLCITESLFKLTDEMLEDTELDANMNPAPNEDASTNAPGKASDLTLKTVLEQRGIAVDRILGKDEVHRLLKASGRLAPEEIAAAAKFLAHTKNFKASDCPDAQLHRMVLSGEWTPNKDPTPPGAVSIVFGSESAFVEQVDDNKDSVWLLAVIVPTRLEEIGKSADSTRTYGDSVVTSEVWGRLVHMYKPFGFKLGLIDCRVVQSVCLDRGFIAADLVLALPKGDDRIKDAVQFRPYPRHLAHSPRLTKVSFSTTQALQHIRGWMSSLLSERVPDVTSMESLIPASLRPTGGIGLQSKGLKFQWFPWLRRRPQPLHLIWMPNAHSTGPPPPPPSSASRCEDAPPMVLSALSVPFTGRVRFGAIREPVFNRLSGSGRQGDSLRSIHQGSIKNPSDLLYTLNCPPDATYVIITPEAKCLAFGKKKGEYPGYANMALFLRFLYPSVDDCMLLFVFLVNLLVLLNSALDAGVMLSHIRHHTASGGNSLPSPPVSHRLNLARAVVRLARRGWTSHTPSRRFVDNTDDVHQISTGSLPHTSVCRKQLLAFCKHFCLDILSSNFLILITILPLINILNLPHASCLVNVSLLLLRSLAMSSPAVSLRLSIMSGRLTYTRFALFLSLLWLSLVIVTCCVYPPIQSMRIRPGRRRSTRRISCSSLQRLYNRPADQLVSELTRLLLATSDTDAHRDRTTSSNTSSTVEAEVQPNSHASSAPNNDTVTTRHPRPEANRLLHRLNSLHRLLLDGEHIVNSSTSLIPSLPPSSFDESDPRNRSAVNAAPAHIYTWQFAVSNSVSNLSETPAASRPTSTSAATHRKEPNHLNSSRNLRCTYPPAPHTLLGVYEAEDEQDESEVEQTNCPNVRRRFRRHRPCLPLRSDSSSSRSDTEGEDPTSSGESNSTNNWPLWVIHCESCVVCWRTFRPRVRLGALPCGHGFHEACIRRWLDTGALDCPVCRWPAYAPHLRQQRQMIGQLLAAVRSTLHATRQHSLTDSATSERMRDSVSSC